MQAECVDETFAVFRGVLPFVAQRHRADARGLEQFVRPVFRVVAPHLYIVRRESERFHPAVADFAAVGRLVAVQHRLAFFFDGFDQAPDVGRVLAAHHRVGQRLVVVDRVELAFEVLFQQVRVIDVFDGVFQYHGFFFREVNQLRYVAEMGRFFVQTDAVARFLDYEARFAEGVDVAVDRAARHREPLGQLVDIVGRVGRQQFHQPQQAFQFGLIHRCEDTKKPRLHIVTAPFLFFGSARSSLFLALFFRAFPLVFLFPLVSSCLPPSPSVSLSVSLRHSLAGVFVGSSSGSLFFGRFCPFDSCPAVSWGRLSQPSFVRPGG